MTTSSDSARPVSRPTATQVLDGVDLTGRRMLVTGGLAGIGVETTRALAAAGAEVTVAVRRPVPQLPDDLRGVHQVRLDLADLTSVRKAALAWDGPLDALVANAGVMAVPRRQVTPQGWELQLGTNFLGHLALAWWLHDAMTDAARTTGESRLVVVSSGAHRNAAVDLDDPHFERRPYDPWQAYAQSKTADVLLAVAAARHWADDGILANALAPGWIHTGLQRHVDAATMRSFGAMDTDGNLLVPSYYKSPAQGAATSALLAGSPLVSGMSGHYFEDERVVQIGDGPTDVAPHAVDDVTADRLWALALDALTTA